MAKSGQVILEYIYALLLAVGIHMLTQTDYWHDINEIRTNINNPKLEELYYPLSKHNLRLNALIINMNYTDFQAFCQNTS